VDICSASQLYVDRTCITIYKRVVSGVFQGITYRKSQQIGLDGRLKMQLELSDGSKT